MSLLTLFLSAFATAKLKTDPEFVLSVKARFFSAITHPKRFALGVSARSYAATPRPRQFIALVTPRQYEVAS